MKVTFGSFLKYSKRGDVSGDEPREGERFATPGSLAMMKVFTFSPLISTTEYEWPVKLWQANII